MLERNLKDDNNIYRGKYKEFIQEIIAHHPECLLESIPCETECHHVIPRCCGGTDDSDTNIFLHLRYRDHFIAHKILVEENPDHKGLLLAWHLMCNDHRHDTTPEEYEDCKRAYSRYKSEQMKGNTISKGVKHTEIARKHMSDSKIGNTNRRGYREPPEVRAKMAKAHIGITWTMSEEGRRNVALAHPPGEKHPNYGKTHSLESRQRRSETTKGEGNGFYGKHHTEESLQKIRAASSRTDYDRICKVCGSHFLGGTSAKYCSDECRWENYYRLHPEARK